MKDIDFDELDKAVTSLMGGVPTNDDTPRPDDGVKTLVIKTSQPLPAAEPVASVPVSVAPVAPVAAEAQPEVKPTVEIPKRAAPMTNRPAPSLATRRGGRFMDVMHPSSDMAKVTTPVVSRNAGSIEPLNAVVTPDARPIAEPIATPTVQPTAVNDEVVSEWPDPLDMLQEQDAIATDAAVIESAPQDIMSSADDQAEPLVSPFLPDAKVEKRPLGGFATDTSVESEATPVNETIPEAQSVPVAPAEPVMLPEELQGDLMAIESSQADTTGPAAVATPSVTAQPAPMPKRADTAPRPQQPAGPASIPQQYKESPSTGDATNGAIYDTDAYHQPLQHPVQKKPSWLWIVWIAGLLIIGAGGGAVAYLFLLK